MSNSLFDDLQAAVGSSRFGNLLPTILMAWGAFLAATTPTRSTYICPITLNQSSALPLLQILGVGLDVFVVMILSTLLTAARNQSQRAVLLGSTCITTATFLIIGNGIFLYYFPENWNWVVDIDFAYVSSALKCALLLSVFVALLHYLFDKNGVLKLSVIVCFVCTYVPQMSSIWSGRTAFPPISNSLGLFSLFLSFLGFGIFIYGESTSEPSSPQVNYPARSKMWFYTLMTTLLLFSGITQVSRSNIVGFHPIDVLIYNARLSSDYWVKQASSSDTLAAAVTEYRTRHEGKYPPPNFDKWFAFAKSRGSLVIDDYDQINRDLLPFWAMAPSVIRYRTSQILENEWHEVAGLSIRNGTAMASPHVLPTHRWMMDGAVSMINTFAQWLPDMDLALNINDECRVAVAYDEIERCKKQGRRTVNVLRPGEEHGFSNNATTGWIGSQMEEEVRNEARSDWFENHSFEQTFHRYGASGCPPNSAARKNRQRNTQDLCTSCIRPHSLGQFLQNWTTSADLCHQPDMANLHGFHLSPAAYKTSNRLVPVFSQSKVHGYNDILYPSPWNYIDKVAYDPAMDRPFSEKANTLFWRGATSEGVSFAHTWEGMQRQRLVHLVNNSTNTSLIPILLPESKPGKFKYQNVKADELKPLLRFDVGIVDKIARCGGKDCETQEKEFGLTSGTDFQAHWSYKYLFDVDGAGFSGRFLPFLQSRSLPFKAAMFREWYDDRLTAWLHFVPLDGRLHAVHSTMAYFAGLKGMIGGQQVEVIGNEKNGEWIAEQGKKWAEQVLRKEDMEVYFFRLLLEYGRLVDDRRDGIGFDL